MAENTIHPMNTILKEEVILDSVEEPSTASCIFCLRILPSDDTPSAASASLRKKIEFVLADRLQSAKVFCCGSCSQMFELFYNFKKSCLLALSKKEELLQSMARGDAERRNVQMIEIRELPNVEGRGKVFKCSVCSKEFMDEDEHRYHINEHFGVKPFRCQMDGCRHSFTNPKDCFVHEAQCSVTPPIWECTICSFRFPTEDELETHRISHVKPKFQCTRCLTSFYYKFDWKSHIKDCKFKVEDPLDSIKVEDPLDSIKEEEVSLEDLEEEIIAEEIDDSEDSDQEEIVEKAEEQPKKQRPTERVCKHCDQTFPLAHNIFLYHQRKCKPQKTFQCHHCERTFSKKMTLETHLNMVAGVKRYACRKPGCDRTFFGYSSRRTHETNCGRTSNFVCDVCGATLGSLNSLRTHRSGHDEPKYPCEHCDKRFKVKRALVKHASTHSEERKFECQTCGKRFKSAEANRVHQRIHTLEKPYPCPECGQRFTYNCSLKAHLEKRACLRQ